MDKLESTKMDILESTKLANPESVKMTSLESTKMTDPESVKMTDLESTKMTDLVSTKKRALRILGNRNFSEHEMQRRLVSKGETQENSEETVRWLVELGYINDADYAGLIVRHYSAKGYGVSRIRDELYKRGIPRDLWDEKLAMLDESGTSDATLEFLRKKLGESKDKDDLRRAADSLVRRGFTYDEARTAVNRYMSEHDDM